MGFFDDYDTWLNNLLESESPLSDIVLELSCCSSDTKRTVSLLHNYCEGKMLDQIEICNRIRLFFKREYHSNRMNKQEITENMYRVSQNIAEACESGISADLWKSMYCVNDYYCLADKGVISWRKFDTAFFSYLDEGIPINDDLIWEGERIRRPSLLERLKRLFSK